MSTEPTEAEVEAAKASLHDIIDGYFQPTEVVTAALRAAAMARPTVNERPAVNEEALTAAYRYAQSHAVTARARGQQDVERDWLDLLHLLDRAAPSAAQPAPDAH